MKAWSYRVLDVAGDVVAAASPAFPRGSRSGRGYKTRSEAVRAGQEKARTLRTGSGWQETEWADAE